LFFYRFALKQELGNIDALRAKRPAGLRYCPDRNETLQLLANVQDFYGYPTDHNKYDVMQGTRLNFIEYRIGPLCARLEAEEQRTVKAIDPNAVGWFDLDALPIMQQTRRDRLAAAKTGFDMGIPFNELNRVLDLGFQPLPWGNTGYLPSKYQPLNSSSSSNPETQKSRSEIQSGV
jgi:hypothetical protein